MSKAKDIINKRKHSKEFLEILKEDFDKRYDLIRMITHSKPLLVFWVAPNGEVLDAKSAHHDNPPKGDRSVLADTSYKGHLRGRAAYIGKVIYILIYGKGKSDPSLSKQQIVLLKKSLKSLLVAIKNKNPNTPQIDIDSAQLVNEDGEDILI